MLHVIWPIFSADLINKLVRFKNIQYVKIKCLCVGGGGFVTESIINLFLLFYESMMYTLNIIKGAPRVLGRGKILYRMFQTSAMLLCLIDLYHHKAHTVSISLSAENGLRIC